MNASLLIAADTAYLVSFYKPMLAFAVFLPWAWIVSSKLDKDAKYYHLNQPMWNSIHMAAGVAALAAMLFIPIFWIGWPVGILVLGGPVYTYLQVRNRSVPEEERFSLSGEGMSARLESRRLAKAARSALIRFSDHQGKDRNVPVKDDPVFPVHVLAEDLIAPALAARATQLQVDIGANGAAVSQIIDGIRYKREAIPADAALKVIDYLKDPAGLDVEDRRRQQVGEFSMIAPDGESRITLTTAGSSSGQVMRLEFDRSKRVSKPFDDLGLLPSQLEALRTLEEAHNRHGIVLVGGPRGHGLSTSCYAFVGRHDAYTSNIKTLEREILTRIDGVDHVQFDPSNPDIDYSTNLQSILRRDPDIVLTGQIHDSDTAAVASEPGMDGPLLYIPQRIGAIGEQIRDWVKQVGDLRVAATPLRAVTNQRLMRKLCANCKQPFTPTAEQLQKLNLPANKVSKLYRAGGKIQVKNKIENCPVCGGGGYLGQTGAFEVMMVDEDVRRLLASGDLKGALAHARRAKMIYLQEAALSKVISGETTIDEVARVTAQPRNAPTPRPQADPTPA